jgi:hypothetical protein
MTTSLLRLIAQHYPNDPDYQQTQDYREFYESIRYVIPNLTIRDQYNMYMDNRPIVSYLDNTDHLLGWVNDFNHMVNESTIDSFLKQVGQTYPELPTFQDTLNYEHFFRTVQNVLPFKYMRDQYTQFMTQYPIDRYLISRKYMIEWINQLHETLASSKANHPIGTIIEHYTNSNDNLSLLLTSLVILGIIVYIST